MRSFFLASFAIALLMNSTGWAADPKPIYIDQGRNWTEEARTDFYSRDQGSRMIPLAWLKVLKQPNGQAFLPDGLTRYGYLPNPKSKKGLPVGFTASGVSGAEVVGMTCSACHTRQIIVEDKTYRIDGGPAIVDFQSLLTDLDAAVGQVLASDAAFNGFAVAVFSPAKPDADDIVTLRESVNLWYLRFDTLMKHALPTPAWGPGRLDAVGMIFNRVTGLDIGPPPSYLIADNIKKADAPVRYPFLWNAPIQDKTQWPGFADNGNEVLALSRNLGEVFGVFGVFEPKREGFFIRYLNNNSANFEGLLKLEDLVKQIGPPRWPWPVDKKIAAKGAAIFARSTADGGCVECHKIQNGQVRFPDVQTWLTPIKKVGTDTREYDVLGWPAKTGTLKGAFIPFATKPLKDTDTAFNVLATSVIGSIAEQALKNGVATTESALVATVSSTLAAVEADILKIVEPSAPAPKATRLSPALRDLEGAFRAPTPPSSAQQNFTVQGKTVPELATPAAPPPERGSYEARVMQGIWAAAPYLHNGSVPTLADLLKPHAQRTKEFKIGPAYDIVNVGLATNQTQFDTTLVTTGCDTPAELNSGNSNCGHEYGTQLLEAEKRALIEYLKTL
jgi:hypothetical protein